MENIKIHCRCGYQKTEYIHNGNAANATLQSEKKHTQTESSNMVISNFIISFAHTRPQSCSLVGPAILSLTTHSYIYTHTRTHTHKTHIHKCTCTAQSLCPYVALPFPSPHHISSDPFHSAVLLQCGSGGQCDCGDWLSCGRCQGDCVDGLPDAM